MNSSGHIHIPPRKIVVITAPSGAGKSTVVKKLITQRNDLTFSISCTTREKRKGELNGVDYYFLSVEDFKKKLNAGEFIEHEEVYAGQFYGTLKSEVERIWNGRKIALFDVDVKGAARIKEIYDKDALVIFIAPPDKETLLRRLTNRNTESKDSLKKRIAKAGEELSYQSKFDKVVVNHDFDVCFMNVKNVITNFLKQPSSSAH
jgi:guanylate kinase